MDGQRITPEHTEICIGPKTLMPDYTLGDIDLSLRSPLDNGRRAIQPEQSLGYLSFLPLEILTDMMTRLDLLSSNNFRQVNKSAMKFSMQCRKIRPSSDTAPRFFAVSSARKQGTLILERYIKHSAKQVV